MWRGARLQGERSDVRIVALKSLETLRPHVRFQGRVAGMLNRIGLVVFVAFSAGCLSNTAPRIRAPKWNPEAAADKAMVMDTDADGFLTPKELTEAPGLKAVLPNLDADGDKKLSREEVLMRIDEYAKNRTGMMEFRCVIRYKNRPLSNANVRLVPEPFISDKVVAASGKTKADGQVLLASDDQLEPFMQPGIYRVEITSDTVKLPAKYNVATELGVEVAPFTVEGQPSPMEFNLR